jgi:putative thioredoxin
MSNSPYVFDAGVEGFETDVLAKSVQTPVLVDFWATWCGPCKTLGPILEKLAAEFNGGFVLAKVDVDKEQQLAGYFQIRSVPTVMLVKGGQIVDGFPGALPEGQLRQFLAHHGVVPLDAAAAADEPEVIELSLSPEEQVQAARDAIAAAPDKPELRLELIAALLQAGESAAAESELDALPANLATDDRAKRARAQLDFAKALHGAPGENELVVELTANSNNHRARHQLGVRRLLAGDSEGALECFLAIMRADRKFDDDLGRKSLIAAFALIDDPDLVSRTRKQMAALIF